MIIDILSDLHIDFYFSREPRAKEVQITYENIFTEHGTRRIGDVLVISTNN